MAFNAQHYSPTLLRYAGDSGRGISMIIGTAFLFTKPKVGDAPKVMGTYKGQTFKQGMGQTSKAFSQTGKVPIRYNSQGAATTSSGIGSLDKKI